MNSWRLAFEDMKALWSSRVLRVSMLGLMVLPLLYSFLYLWAFWDPTGQLHRLPLAVVNEDTGIDSQGRQSLFGEQLVDELLSNKKLSWTLLPRDRATGLFTENKMAGILVIPSDFSRAASSVGTDDPEHPRLTLILNEGHNPLSAKIVRSVMEEIKKKLNVKLTTGYLEVIFDQILNGRQGLTEAANGATSLAEGTGKAYDGAVAVSNGLLKLQSGMNKLLTGLNSLQQGANELDTGLSKLDSTLTGVSGEANTLIEDWKRALAGLGDASKASDLARTRLDTSIETLRNASSALSAAVDGAVQNRVLFQNALAAAGPLRSTLETQSERASAMKASLQSFLDDHPELTKEETAKIKDSMDKLLVALTNSTGASRKVLDSLDQAAAADQAQSGSRSGNLSDAQAKLEQAAESLAKLADNVSAAGQDALNRVEGEIPTLKGKLSRISELFSGVSKLAQGSTRLADGLSSFGNGLEDASTGINQLAEGAVRIPQGLAQIREGQLELAGKLSEAAQMADSDGHSGERIAVIADPLAVQENNAHPVSTNGMGFAPYFIALSLWVGSLVLFFIIDIHTVTSHPRHPISYIGSKYLALGSVSLSQSILSVFVLHAALGVYTTLPFFHLYGLAAITGLTFAAILFLLIGVLGQDKGRFAAVVVLMLQLTSSSGSYPVELEPGLFRFLHPLMPMTYAVDGFRQVISVGDYGEFLKDCAILAAYGLGAMILLYALKHRSIRAEMSNISKV